MFNKTALQIYSILIILLISSCSPFRPAPVMERNEPGKPEIIRTKTGKKEIHLSIAWDKDNDQPQTYCVLTLPHGVVETSIEDFSLIINEYVFQSTIKSKEISYVLIPVIKTHLI